jgi:hypothetical protein
MHGSLQPSTVSFVWLRPAADTLGVIAHADSALLGPSLGGERV